MVYRYAWTVDPEADKYQWQRFVRQYAIEYEYDPLNEDLEDQLKALHTLGSICKKIRRDAY